MAHLRMAGEFGVRRERVLAQASGRVLTLSERSLTDGSLQSGSYDTIVSVHTLCRVDDLDVAIARIDELLAPGGRVLLLEHVWALGARGRAQNALATGWRRMPGGCQINCDPIAAFRNNGFAVIDCDRFRVRALPIVAPHISAVAIRKAKPPVEETAMEAAAIEAAAIEAAAMEEAVE